MHSLYSKKIAMSEEDEIGRELKSGQKKRRAPSIAVPMVIWIILLLIGLLLNAFATINNPAQASINSLIMTISNFILNLPGIVIMPIVFGATIGAIAGMKGRSIRDGANLGAIDGVYASVIYVIAIVVVYLIMFYSLPTTVPTLTFLAVYWLVLPVILTILLSTILASIMSLRK